MPLSSKKNLFPNLQQNSFTLQSVRGLLAFGASPNLMSVALDPSDERTYFVGDAVTLNLKSTLKKGFIVEKATAKSPVDGIVLYNTKIDRFSKATNETVFEICFDSVPIYMEASGPIARGDKVSVDDSDVKENILRIKKAVEGDTVIGKALESASQAGDIFMMMFRKN